MTRAATNEKPDHMVTVRMTESQHKRLLAAAAKDRRSMNKFCVEKLNEAAGRVLARPIPPVNTPLKIEVENCYATADGAIYLAIRPFDFLGITWVVHPWGAASRRWLTSTAIMPATAFKQRVSRPLSARATGSTKVSA